MKTVILEIDDEYNDALCISAIGGFGHFALNISTGAYKLKNGDRIVVGADGKITQINNDGK